MIYKMKEIVLKVNKANVYEEVAELSAYVGAKKTGDEGAFTRISVTDSDRQLLERFWAESSSVATDRLKRFVVASSEDGVSHGVELGENYEVTLMLSNLFDEAVKQSIEGSLFSFFVDNIVAKWYMVTNREDAEAYAVEANNALEDAVRKVFHKKRPMRR